MKFMTRKTYSGTPRSNNCDSLKYSTLQGRPFWIFWASMDSCDVFDCMNEFYDPRNQLVDTLLNTGRYLSKFWSFFGNFGGHLGFGATLVVRDFKTQIRILQPKLRKARHQTRHQSEIQEFSALGPQFLPPFWIWGVWRKIELDNIEILFLDIKTKRLSYRPNLHHTEHTGTFFWTYAPELLVPNITLHSFMLISHWQRLQCRQNKGGTPVLLCT